MLADNTENTTVVKIPIFTTEDAVLENDTKAKIIEQFKNNWAVKDWTQGFFSEEYIYEINIHWLQFSSPSATSFLILGILYIFIMSIGIFGNCLVIFMFIRCKNLRTPANTLIANLAVSDGLMMLKMPLFIYNCFYKGPVLGDIACRLYGFFGGLTGTVSIVTLASISFDRYCVIKYPFSRKYSSMRVNICLIFSWIYGISFSLIPFLNIGYGKYQYEGYLTSCSFDYLTEDNATRIFILIFFCAAWVIPFSIIVFSYYKIVQVVGGRSLPVSGKRDSFRHMKEEDIRKQEIKLAVIVLSVIFIWFFSWTPYATVALLGISGQKHLITPLGSMIPALFAKMASAIDPYVYAISHPKLREELWKMLGINTTKKPAIQRKVWSIKSKPASPKNYESRDYNEDVEEVLVEIEMKPMSLGKSSIRNDVSIEELKDKNYKFERQASIASMQHLKPSFSNKTANLKKKSRRLSSFTKFKSEDEMESKT